MGNKTKEKMHQGKSPEFISPMALAVRWNVGRSSVDRIADKQGLSRTYLSGGRNGIVRFRISEVEDLERKLTFKRRI